MSKIQAFFRGFSRWCLFTAKQRRTRLFLSLLTIAAAAFLIRSTLVHALSKAFVQTDWSGGADTAATADGTHLTDWTKFYSKDSTVDTGTAGEIKLNLTISQP